MSDEHREFRPPVTVRELVEGEIVGVARVDFEDDGAGAGTNVIEVPGGHLAAGQYELEFDDGTRFVVNLEPQPDDPSRLNIVEVQ